MLIALSLLVGFLVLQALVQLLIVALYLKELRRKTPVVREDERLPKAAIVLSTRGADETLGDCVRALLDMDYPDYDIHVVVDSEIDPGWQIVANALQDDHDGRGHRHVLQRREQCTLKCSAVLQAIESTSADVELFAFVDSDIVPDRDWLRRLLSPLTDDRFAAATGQRWFVPTDRRWGSLVRAIWNGGAAVSMIVTDIPWGGTMAMRREFIEQQELLTTWSQAFTEDAVISERLKDDGRKLAFVPELTLFDPGGCPLTGCWRFLRRQMFNTRQDHCRFILFTMLTVTLLAQIASVVLIGVSSVQREFVTAAIGAGGLLLHFLILTIIWRWHRGAIDALFPKQTKIGVRTGWLRDFFASILTQLWSGTAAIACLFQRRVTWRGITYDVRSGPWRPRMLGYEPWSSSAAAHEGDAVLTTEGERS